MPFCAAETTFQPLDIIVLKMSYSEWAEYAPCALNMAAILQLGSGGSAIS